MNAIELYRTPTGETQIEVRFEKDTVWLSLNQISELFGHDKPVISRHLKTIYKETELDYNSTVAKNATVQKEGKRTSFLSIACPEKSSGTILLIKTNLNVH